MSVSAKGQAVKDGPLLLDMIGDVVVHMGDELALVKDDVVVSYWELDQAVACLSADLRGWGVRAEDRVGIAHGTGIDGAVAALAIMEAGAAFVPLETSHPDARLQSVINDAGVSLVLAPEDLKSRVSKLTPDSCRVEEWRFAKSDAAAGPIRTERSSAAHDAQLAYIIFTSGSTGRPKGVMISHRAIANYIGWARTEYTSLGGRAVLHSPLGFDLTLTALFGTLASGGCIVLSDPLSGFSEIPDADFVKGTPSHLPFISLMSGKSPAKELVLGGESLIGENVEWWRSVNPTAEIINEYGPTETTVGCTARRWSRDMAVPPGVLSLGKPISGCEIHVLDAELASVAVGEVGELYISGLQVARGYAAMPGVTAACFVPDPFTDERGRRMYKSGDFGWYDHDGELHFTGRNDSQVKVSGHRIELGDIEANLLRTPGVLEAAAILVADANPQIFGFVRTSDPSLDGDAILRGIRDRVPQYLVPAKVIVVPDLPRTQNGKIDRERLGGLTER
ncbi:amino acid adenylation domain-containing protein [Streptomyces sp. NPDC014684]|uniref:amino acid adenylation domain-containing protein n=1 Tax=Streptomyces sp. NPDC014684 TaxID=3364880 RepID=UPI0037001A7F